MFHISHLSRSLSPSSSSSSSSFSFRCGDCTLHFILYSLQFSNDIWREVLGKALQLLEYPQRNLHQEVYGSHQRRRSRRKAIVLELWLPPHTLSTFFGRFQLAKCPKPQYWGCHSLSPALVCKPSLPSGRRLCLIKLRSHVGSHLACILEGSQSIVIKLAHWCQTLEARVHSQAGLEDS